MTLQPCNRRGAFLLPDCLAALFCAGILFTLLTAVLLPVSRLQSELDDRRTAILRAENVAAKLRLPALFCGIGLSKDPALYKRGFNNRSEAPFFWNGPLEITSGVKNLPASGLRIVYGCFDGLVAAKRSSSSTGAITVTLKSKPSDSNFEPDLYNKQSSVKNWVVLDGRTLSSPLWLTGLSDRLLSLKSVNDKSLTVRREEKLFLVRAIECWAADGVFRTNDLRTTGNQPREDGICDLRFRLDGEARLLEIFILVHGSEGGIMERFGLANRMEAWPSDFSPPECGSGLRHHSFHYRLKLPNL